MIIEICATSIESILNAQNAGAHRLELCQNYSIGGVTPSEQFLHGAIKVSSLVRSGTSQKEYPHQP